MAGQPLRRSEARGRGHRRTFLQITIGDRFAHFVRLPPQPSDVVLQGKGGGHACAVLRPALGTSFTYTR